MRFILHGLDTMHFKLVYQKNVMLLHGVNAVVDNEVFPFGYAVVNFEIVVRMHPLRFYVFIQVRKGKSVAACAGKLGCDAAIVYFHRYYRPFLQICG